MNKYSKFQVNTFSNNRDITKCQKFLDVDDDKAKAIAIPLVFSKNSKAKTDKSMECHLLNENENYNASK